MQFMGSNEDESKAALTPIPRSIYRLAAAVESARWSELYHLDE
jgi:hypothetical protein